MAAYSAGLRVSEVIGLKVTDIDSKRMMIRERGFSRFIDSLMEHRWVVYSKKPFGGPEQALDYIGRYTHRVAISNNRIINVKDGRVTLSPCFLCENKEGEPLLTETESEEMLRKQRGWMQMSLSGGFFCMCFLMDLCESDISVSLQTDAKNKTFSESESSKVF